ncbi:MAG TPA: DUF4287 domain-containing protein [Nocardioidaceae bacterium]|nr:DUF4287 domain-containing protein [Nocardioidaceae bacterium]
MEEKTGLTPRQLIERAHAHGFDEASRSGEIATWLKTAHGLGHGHAMALVHVIKHGPQISSTHVGSPGSHRDESNTLWLDGRASKH